ncbi:hypothetical protein APHAL10511_001861 [Amanita phalloides]|nr:hypothetical protein APHAL10511_001861 [Amanita phalloides]
MDRFLAPHTPEALAHFHLTENWPNWNLDHPSIDEDLIAGCASYRAFDRYLSGADLFLPPRTRTELESILQVNEILEIGFVTNNLFKETILV